jgi:hypothetical protein
VESWWVYLVHAFAGFDDAAIVFSPNAAFKIHIVYRLPEELVNVLL